MHVVIMGLSQWAVPTIAGAIAEADVTVVTYDERTLPRRMSPWVSLTDYCAAASIPVVHDSWPPSYRWRRSLSGDVLISSNWRHRIPDHVRAGWSLAALNVHRSLLPAYRGASPLNWAISCGETRTGVTIHLLHGDLDCGDIVAQEALQIGAVETATSLFGRANLVVERLVRETLCRLREGRISHRAQSTPFDEPFPSRTADHLEIDWGRPRRQVLDLIRAQSAPFPNATSRSGGRHLSIDRARPVERTFAGLPGLVAAVMDDGAVVILCGPAARGARRGLAVGHVRFADSSLLASPRELLPVGTVLGQ
jgi:methionyl-tRNA formyltransferase